MPRSTELPQRQLAQELRFAIEDAMATGRMTQLFRLVDENPQGVRSAHVRHNLGTARLGWLEKQLRDR